MQTKEQYEQEINKFYESWGVGDTLEQRKNFWNKKEPNTHVSTNNDVLYKDLQKLLDDKSPDRSASTNDLAKLINKKINQLQKLCDDTFLKKDEVNYGWAVSQREQANILLRAANILTINLDEQ